MVVMNYWILTFKKDLLKRLAAYTALFLPLILELGKKINKYITNHIHMLPHYSYKKLESREDIN